MRAAADSTPPPAIPLNGAEILLDPLGALVWPAEHLVAMSDLHLEKGSSFARRGQMLPPYDTEDTLARAEQVIARWRPRIVIALGDSLHDRTGAERLQPSAFARLRTIQASRTFIWIAGNHDPDPAPLLGGEWAREVTIGALTFRHEPSRTAQAGEVAGHLHPSARLVVRGRSIRRKCFATDERRMVLPALGAYAGGLNVRHPALSGLFAGAFQAHMLGAARTYRMEARACLSD
ncbi:ligase-associated DNA damage response endonuclease PdeM [Aquabacter spiritensis]|nr:ligase-associated DNA damage response endonuclease PdeM [Aquabacter spiritensis]